MVAVEVRDGELDDVQMSALSTFMLGAGTDLAAEMLKYSTTGRRKSLEYLIERGQRVIADPYFAEIARAMRYDKYPILGCGDALASLAMHHGGIRLFGLIFCAAHSPGGALAGGELVCPQCAPGGRFA